LWYRGEQQKKNSIVDILYECEKIFKKYQKREYILKMDCDGPEYEILEKMNKEELLNKFSIIMLEWHYNGTEIIEEYLKKNNFVYFNFKKSNNIGTIYAFNKAFR